jgi:hypothetical protein
VDAREHDFLREERRSVELQAELDREVIGRLFEN